jgi:hypothetical protein
VSLAIAKGLVLPEGSRFSVGAVPAAIAGVAPTLDFRPALERREIEAVSLTDKLTFTGGNQGTFVGSDGFIQRATTNAPRFTHDPATRRSLGMRLEASRTNSIRNNTMVGAVAGTPGISPTNWSVSTTNAQLTASITSVGVDSGIAYLDIQLSGTVTAQRDCDIGLEATNVIAAASGQLWTQSSYFKLVGGSFANVANVFLQANTYTSGGAYITTPWFTPIAPKPTSAGLATQRYTAGTSLAGATTAFIAPFIKISTAISGLINITLRIGLPQLEQGSDATSAIPTTTAAVTRTADSAVIDGTGVIAGTYTMVEKPEGCAVISGTNINLQTGYTVERVMIFPATLTAGQITAIRAAM